MPHAASKHFKSCLESWLLLLLLDHCTGGPFVITPTTPGVPSPRPPTPRVQHV